MQSPDACHDWTTLEEIAKKQNSLYWKKKRLRMPFCLKFRMSIWQHISNITGMTNLLSKSFYGRLVTELMLFSMKVWKSCMEWHNMQPQRTCRIGCSWNHLLTVKMIYASQRSKRFPTPVCQEIPLMNPFGFYYCLRYFIVNFECIFLLWSWTITAKINA